MRGSDILSDATVYRRLAENAALFHRIPRKTRYRAARMQDGSPEQVPSKLRARRVRAHVATTLASIQRANIRRDAARCRAIDEVSWESLDLYTIALDLCEDDQTRDLVAQARGTIITHLMQR
jgi:hypothetical protein